jgi:hypothetical protein
MSLKSQRDKSDIMNANQKAPLPREQERFSSFQISD